MKKTLLTILFNSSIIIMSCSTTFSQKNIVSKIFDDYENDEKFTKINITKNMFDFFKNIELDSKDDIELIDAISKLDGIKILSLDAKNTRNIFKSSIDRLKKEKFVEVMTVKDADNEIRFIIDKHKKIITELVMVLVNDNNFLMIDIFGEIDIKQIARISKGMNIEGLENLENLESLYKNSN